MISFELQEEYDFRTFFDHLSVISLAESLGDVESLVCHPASMTHASIPEDIRHKVGITDNLIRLSVGNIVTLFADRGDRYFSKHLFVLYFRNKSPLG